MRDAVRDILLMLLAAWIPLSARAQSAPADVASVTPYRPSVSTPAALSAPGWIEAELGGSRAFRGSRAREDAVPYTVKLAFTPDWGVRVGGNAYLRDTEFDGDSRSGPGDTAFILKRRFGIDDTSAFGVEVGANFPTAKSGLGSGGTDYTVNGIYSADFGRYHSDVNLLFTRVGSIDPTQGRVQTGWAAALSRPFGERWGAVGELSGTRQQGAQNSAQLLIAASYNVSRMMVVDFGVSRGLASGSADWTLFSGITVLIARLF